MAELALVLLARIWESGSRASVDYAVAEIVPPMLLASSRPHDEFSIKVLGCSDRTLAH
jgi:hypothetical protein